MLESTIVINTITELKYFLQRLNNKNIYKSLAFQDNNLLSELSNDLKDQFHRGRFSNYLRYFLLKGQLKKIKYKQVACSHYF